MISERRTIIKGTAEIIRTEIFIEKSIMEREEIEGIEEIKDKGEIEGTEGTEEIDGIGKIEMAKRKCSSIKRQGRSRMLGRRRNSEISKIEKVLSFLFRKIFKKASIRNWIILKL